jgi:hypothetical protein
MKTCFNTLWRAVLISSLIGGWGCVRSGDECDPEPGPEPDPVKTLDEAVYHEGVGAWIVPQDDPYALENVQNALTRLSSGESVQALTPAQRDEFSRAPALAPTHYALRIFPRSEDEQWEVELMEGVRVSYIPFDYVGLTEEEAQDLETAATRAGERPIFAEVNPYVADPGEMRTVEGLVPEDVAYAMPILYAVWPIDKPLPEELDYEIDYEVFLPAAESPTRSTAWSGNALRLLESEAIGLALGCPPPAVEPMTRANIVLSGEFWMWEVLRPIRVPLPRIKVKFQLGSNIVETSADQEGLFSITAASIPTNASWDIVFQDPKWKVTRENTTTPRNYFQGAVYQPTFWSETNTHVRTTIQPFDATIIQALNYFYYKDHNFTKWEVTDGIRVIAHSESSSSYNGLFSYTSVGSCYITIYRNNISNNRNVLAGTVFHEMGHFIHFKERGGTYNGMKSVHRLLQESFASYVGWYLTEKYYAELGYEKADPTRDISDQARQFWKMTRTGDMGYYSPFFVDLVDNFNQGSHYPGNGYNSEEVKGAPYSVIMKMVRESIDWASAKSILRMEPTLVSQDLETFLTPYEYWFTH